MEAAFFDGPKQMRLGSAPDPKANPGEVVLKVGACAVCGTDVRIWRSGHHRISPPAIISHEIAGTVERLGDGVDSVEIGDRVVLSPPAWSCGDCYHCVNGLENLCPERTGLSYERAGGFAQSVVVPAPLVASGALNHISDGLGFDEAAIVEPLACCINGQSQFTISRDDVALIIGVGPIGLMHAALLRSANISKVIVSDVSEQRLAAARLRDVDVVIDAANEPITDRVLELTDGRGADLVVVAVSAKQGYQTAFSVAAKGAKLLLFAGLPKGEDQILFDMNQVHYRQWTILGSYGSSVDQGRKALALLESRTIDPADLVTHRFGLGNIAQAFEVAESLDGLKIVVTP